MDSILKTSGRRKCIVFTRERTYKMVKGDLGTQFKREKDGKSSLCDLVQRLNSKRKTPKRKRGDIEGFSSSSRSRLRVLLSTAKWNGGACRRYGLTLNLPWAASPDEWRRVWHTFVMRLGHKRSNVGMIWRIELTTGKAVTSGGVRRCHVHVMLWIPADDVIDSKNGFVLNVQTKDKSDLIAYLNLRTIAEDWCKSWQTLTPKLTEAQCNYAMSLGMGKGYGISYKPLDNSTDGAIHYLCDHATKHKQEQLGWNGRQWGVVNRHCFTFPSDGETISGDCAVVVKRQLRRYSNSLRRSGSKRAQPYGDNKCFFGDSEKALYKVLEAAKSGKIS